LGHWTFREAPAARTRESASGGEAVALQFSLLFTFDLFSASGQKE